MKRGYFGIGIYNLKNGVNLGTLWRSAFIWGADFIFTIGHRYKKQSSDTTCAFRHIPLFQYESGSDFTEHAPYDCQIICIELGGLALVDFRHPERCAYLLGAEDRGIPKNFMDGKKIITIETQKIFSLNVATAGSIVMYDRLIKQNICQEKPE